MMELSLKIGKEVDTQDLAILMYSISGVLKWVLFIVLAIIMSKYIKKENAHISKQKHSQIPPKKRA